MMRNNPERWLHRVAAELRRPVRLDDEFDRGVMDSVRSMPRHGHRPWTRFLRSRTITVSPIVTGIAATLLFAVALSAGHFLGALRTNRAPGGGDVATSRGNGGTKPGPRRSVQFVLVAPTARKVQLVGDFNDWDASHQEYLAQHRGGGVWSVTAAIPEGHHRYSFVVDDSLWVADPSAPRVLDDDYGLPNSAIVVGGGDAAQ